MSQLESSDKCLILLLVPSSMIGRVINTSLLNCVPCVLKLCSCANVPCVLTCSRANVSCELKCQRVLRAHVPTCLACLRANVSCVLTCQRALRAQVLMCQRVHSVHSRPLFCWGEGFEPPTKFSKKGGLTGP